MKNLILLVSLICLGSCSLVNGIACTGKILCKDDLREMVNSEEELKKIKCDENPTYRCRSKITDKNSFEDIKKAADKGDVYAQSLLSLGLGYRWEDKQTLDEAFKYTEKTADAYGAKGHYSQNLAQYYIEGYSSKKVNKDFKKGVYWAKRSTCGNSFGQNLLLGDLYSKNTRGSNISKEEFSQIETNLPLAYAHYKFGKICKVYCSPGNPLVDELKTRMTKEEIERGEEIADLFERSRENKKCYYESPAAGNERIKVPLFDDTKLLKE